MRTKGIRGSKDKEKGGKSRCSVKNLNFEIYRIDWKEGTSGGRQKWGNSQNGGGSVEKDRNLE